jgi:hypothetical protein
LTVVQWRVQVGAINIVDVVDIVDRVAITNSKTSHLKPPEGFSFKIFNLELKFYFYSKINFFLNLNLKLVFMHENLYVLFTSFNAIFIISFGLLKFHFPHCILISSCHLLSFMSMHDLLSSFSMRDKRAIQNNSINCRTFDSFDVVASFFRWGRFEVTERTLIWIAPSLSKRKQSSNVSCSASINFNSTATIISSSTTELTPPAFTRYYYPSLIV